MQVYRGMDIGTAKPTAPELQQARHHLLDILDPDQDFAGTRVGAGRLLDAQRFGRLVARRHPQGGERQVEGALDPALEGYPAARSASLRHSETILRCHR